MPVFFSNPLGFWALLGIPIVLAIHLLQRHSRRIPTSTLFLLQILERESLQGRRIDRIRSSVPLWLQLLAVLVLTWLMVEPRWPREQSVQRIVLVLDNSASMAAFRETLDENLRRELSPLAREAKTTEYTLIQTSGSGAPLYRGTSLEEMTASLQDWRPGAGSHPPDQALRVGRGIAGVEGTLVLVTDHVGEPLPFDALRLAVGTPIDNAGFAGLAFEESEDGELFWKASIRNHTPAPQVREWFLLAGNKRSEVRRAELGPGETRVIQGPFPAETKRVTLMMNPDRFPQDDTLPFVRPEPKPLLISGSGSAAATGLIGQLVASLEAREPSAGEVPDLWFATYDPLQPLELPDPAVVLVSQTGAPARLFPGAIVAGNHPLMKDLEWQGLLARFSPSIPLTASDQVLLWQGERALILLREEGGRRQLVFNFEVPRSNANRVPAFIILIHRFAERIRSEKVAPETLNTELRQMIRIAANPSGGPHELTTDQGTAAIPLALVRQLRAPGEPGFFTLRQGSGVLLEAAAHFADVREADFSQASSGSELGSTAVEIRERQTVEDPARPLWMGLLAALLMLSWWFLAGRRESGGEIPPMAQQEVGAP